MKLGLPEDKTYVAAISGGVDSMVLLNLLIQDMDKHNWQVIVAHVDHGIRADSAEDHDLVKETAEKNNLVFESIKLSLGPEASEALAREKRYQFLDKTADKYKAEAVITAHHQDDLLETAIINLIRGSGRKGLTSLAQTSNRLRPLLAYSKKDLVAYARNNNVVWREDSTNSDTKYLRNYIRVNIMPHFDDSARSQLIAVINSTSQVNSELDERLEGLIKNQTRANELDRIWFTSLNHALAKEVLATWLRLNDIRSFNKGTLERLVVSAKVARPGQSFPVLQGHYLEINKNTITLKLA